MQALLTRAGGFVAIIILGFVLRRIGFFKASDFALLSKITLRITLPAATIVSFSQMSIDLSMLSITMLAFGCGVLYMGIALLVNLCSSNEQRAFDVLNLSSYNIGLFTMPFAASFLGPVGVVTTALFDVGNAVICLGGAYGVASTIKDGNGFSVKRVLKALFTSVPFVCYLIMVILNLAKIQVPAVIVSWADVIKGANAFLAMLMVGVGFQVRASGDQIKYILKALLVRYGVSAALALICYYLLPFSLEIRQTLVILVFSPVGSAVPAFTSEMKGDVGLSSAVNSICILCSTVIMVSLLCVMLY